MASCCCAWTGEARLQQKKKKRPPSAIELPLFQIHTKEGDRICAPCQHASFYFCGLHRSTDSPSLVRNHQRDRGGQHAGGHPEARSPSRTRTPGSPAPARPVRGENFRRRSCPPANIRSPFRRNRSSVPRSIASPYRWTRTRPFASRSRRAMWWRPCRSRSRRHCWKPTLPRSDR